MKDISDLNKEIGYIENLSDKEISEMKPSVFKRLQKKLELLRGLKKYLETNPTNEFIVNEISRLEMIVTKKMLEFNEDDYEKLTKKEISKLRKAHENMYAIPHLRTQLRALRFLATK